MTAKEYLNEIRTLDTIIRQKRQQLDDLQAIATAIRSFNYAQDRVQTSPIGARSECCMIVKEVAVVSKAILIMDIPKTCDYEECPLCVFDAEIEEYVCARTKVSIERYFTRGKPDWCPFVPAVGYITPAGHMVRWEDDSDGKN